MSKAKRGRVTPPRGTAAPKQGAPRVRLPDGTRSVRSPWVWRGFAFLSLLALGLCIGLAAQGRTTYAALWAVITLGWFSVAMWLWWQHVRDDSA